MVQKVLGAPEKIMPVEGAMTQSAGNTVLVHDRILHCPPGMSQLMHVYS